MLSRSPRVAVVGLLSIWGLLCSLPASFAGEASAPIFVTSSAGGGGSCPGEDCTLTAAWQAAGGNGVIVLNVSSTIDQTLRLAGSTGAPTQLTIRAGVPGVSVTPGLRAKEGVMFINITTPGSPTSLTLQGLTISGFKTMSDNDVVIGVTPRPSSSIKMANVIFTHNNGGNLFSYDCQYCTAELVDCSFLKNQVTQLIQQGGFGASMVVSGLQLMENEISFSGISAYNLNATGLQLVGNSFFNAITVWNNLDLRKTTIAENRYPEGPNVIQMVFGSGSTSVSLSEVEISLATSRSFNPGRYSIETNSDEMYFSDCSFNVDDGTDFTVQGTKTAGTTMLYNRGPANSNITMVAGVTAVGCAGAGRFPCPPYAPRCYDAHNPAGSLVGYVCRG